jgi:hypothetical protein
MGKAWMYLIVGLALCFLGAGAPPQAAAQCFSANQLGSVNSTSGKPFQAEVHESIPTLDMRLYPYRERKSLVARDSQGRVRTEVYVGMIELHPDTGQEVDLTHLVVFICDPVRLQQITIDPVKKTARVVQISSVPEQNESAMKVNPTFCNAQMDLRTYPPTQDREDLGHQNIEGVDVRGVAIRSASLDTEIWCSDELETVVLRETRGGSHIAMTNIQRVEPDAALFVVPADHKKLDGFEAGFQTGSVKSKSR